MIISRLVVVPFVLASFAALVGCTSTVGDSAANPDPNQKPNVIKKADGGTDDPTGGADVCDALCKREVTCDPKADEDTCKSKCNNTNATFVSKLRDDFTGELATCLQKSACKDIDSGEAISTCVDEARATTNVTTKATAFCDEFGKAATKCDMTLDRADCLESSKIYSDGTLADATKCLAKACSDINTCVNAATGSNTTKPEPTPTPDAGSPPPPPDSGTGTCSGAKMPWSSSTCGSCMGALCCEEDNACANSSSCMSYLSCIQSCTTTACDTACGNSYPSGKTLFYNVASCMQSSCPYSCGS